MPATSLPKSGSVTATAAITSAVASFGSHCCFCASVPPLTRARVRISGRVISEPPMPRLSPRLSSSVATTIADVLAVAAFAVAAVLGRHAEPERAHLGEPGDDLLGHVAVVRCTCSACGAITLSANERNVSCTISKSASRWRGPGLVGERRRGTSGSRNWRGTGGRAQRAALEAPQRPRGRQTVGDQVVHHVGGEGAGEPRLDVALGAVVEQRPGGGDAGCGVGEVVGEHLVRRRVRRLAARWRIALADDPVGELDRVGGGEVRRRAGGTVVVLRPSIRGHSSWSIEPT